MVLPIDPPDEKLAAADRARAHARLPVRDPFRRELPARRDHQCPPVVHGRHGVLLRQRRGQQGPDGAARRRPLRPGPEVAQNAASAASLRTGSGTPCSTSSPQSGARTPSATSSTSSATASARNVEKAVKRQFNISRRGLRRQVPPLPAAEVPEDPRREGRADRLRRAVQASRRRPPRISPRALTRRVTSSRRSRPTRTTRTSCVHLDPADRKLYRNLTKGYTTTYEYLVSPVGHDRPAERRDIGVSPDGNTVAVFARRERGRDLLLLNALNGGIRERVEMPELDQQLNPAFSRDGKHRRLPRAQGRTRRHLFLLDRRQDHHEPDRRRGLRLRPRPIRPTGSGSTTPPCGARRSKIFRFRPGDAGAPASSSPTATGTMKTPGCRPTASGIFFTSDRDGGIYNIYSINLETGETLMHTNVVAGRLLAHGLHREGQRREAGLLRLLQAAVHPLHRGRQQVRPPASGPRARDLARGTGVAETVPARDRGRRRPREDQAEEAGSSSSRTRRWSRE